MQRSQTSAEGSLYELVARGSKDKYFIEDDKKSIHPFDWRYERWPSSIPEERWTVPLNPAKFGARCEFEFDLPGDVLTEAAIVIDLPSWLPPEMTNFVKASQTVDQDGKAYGYVNGIAYFLFERIEIYQDKILLQEVSGDSLYVSSLTKGTWNQAYLTEKLAGIHDGSDLGIMRNAVPGRLEIPLPMIGCFPGDKGLPLCGLRQQPFRLRLTLRPLENLIESTGSSITPWLKTFTQTTTTGIVTLPAVSRDNIKQPTLFLRTKQLYLSNEARAQLANEIIEIPYIRYFENVFNINQLDYNSINNGATGVIVRYLDASYTVERIVSYFRNNIDVGLNRLWNFVNSVSADGQYYLGLQLIIAGKVREEIWPPAVWQNVVGASKEDRSFTGLAIMNWSRGWRIEGGHREPTGGINFTTADRPMLSITLNDVAIDPVLGYKQVHMISCCESWAIYKIRNGRGGLEYAN